jgi:hypothetical protein
LLNLNVCYDAEQTIERKNVSRFINSLVCGCIALIVSINTFADEQKRKERFVERASEALATVGIAKRICGDSYNNESEEMTSEILDYLTVIYQPSAEGKTNWIEEARSMGIQLEAFLFANNEFFKSLTNKTQEELKPVCTEVQLEASKKLKQLKSEAEPLLAEQNEKVDRFGEKWFLEAVTVAYGAFHLYEYGCKSAYFDAEFEKRAKNAVALAKELTSGTEDQIASWLDQGWEKGLAWAKKGERGDAYRYLESADRAAKIRVCSKIVPSLSRTVGSNIASYKKLKAERDGVAKPKRAF